jgi:hypothetical protein
MSTVNIPITGDATSLVAATQKATAALNTIGVAADKASAKITPAMGNLTTGAQKAAAALGPLGGVLSKISPEAGAAASSIAGLASAGQGLSGALQAAAGSAGVLELAMGPVGIAVAAVSAAVAIGIIAYGNYKRGAEETAAAQTALAEANDLVKGSQDRIKDSAYDLKKAKGELTREDVVRRAETIAGANLAEQSAKNAVAAQKNVAGAVKATSVELGINAAAHALAGKDVETLADKEKKRAQAVTQTYTGIGVMIDVTRGKEARAAGELAGFEFDKDKRKEKDAENAKAKSERDRVSAKATSDANKRAEDAARAQKEAINAVATAQTALASITHDSSVSNLDALGKEADAYQIKLDRIYELTAAALANAKAAGLGDTKILADSLAAQEAVEKEHAQNVAKIKTAAAEKEQKEYEDRIAKLDALNVQAAEKALSDAETAFTAQLSVAEGYYAAAGKLSGLLTEATSKDFDTSTEAGKDAAIKQFNTQKAVAVALSIAQGALAVVQAIGSAPPPFNIPAIVATGIAVTAETATIAAQQPKFHAGTTGFRPDEGGATLQRGEGVVTSAGMSKPGMKEAVAAANSGRTPGGNGGSMNMVYQHKVYNEFIRDNLKAGSPLTRRIDSGTKVGHRQSRS